MTQEKNKSDEQNAEKEYESLSRKYSLPGIKELNKEFCIGKLEDPDYVLRSVINKMSERLEHIFKSLSDIIQPSDNSFSSMYEAEAFQEEEKKKIFEAMKKLAYYHRETLINDFDYNEAAAAELIKKLYSEWLSMKKEVIEILKKLRDCWNNKSISKFQETYFG